MALSVRDKAAPWTAAALCLLPLAYLIYRAFSGDLGANPIEEITRELGVWGLRFIIAGLAITPAARLLRQPKLIRLRRPIGLMAFAYVLLHLSSYIGLDQFFDWNAIVKDILKRPYITFGMLAFVLLIPLAITSTNAMIRRVGPRAWRRIHQAVYLIGALGVLHYFLLVKADHRPPLIYGAILAALLGYRIYAWAKPRFARPQTAR
ncbi:MAG: protein-methionine-sulfoxide reductase heme-binding subunit MsrQ [Caulobacterales bacterium]